MDSGKSVDQVLGGLRNEERHVPHIITKREIHQSHIVGRVRKVKEERPDYFSANEGKPYTNHTQNTCAVFLYYYKPDHPALFLRCVSYGVFVTFACSPCNALVYSNVGQRNRAHAKKQRETTCRTIRLAVLFNDPRSRLNTEGHACASFR